jgi:hypothetical protein
MRKGMKIDLRVMSLRLLVVAIGGALWGCAENCSEVACAPAPVPLQVAVFDSIQVDTTFFIDSLGRSVDSSIHRLGYIHDATVRLQRVIGADTVDFETLAVSDASDSALYQRLTTIGLPSDTNFVITATRGTKWARAVGLRVKHVGGCCPYDVIGRYGLTLR